MALLTVFGKYGHFEIGIGMTYFQTNNIIIVNIINIFPYSKIDKLNPPKNMESLNDAMILYKNETYDFNVVYMIIL